MQQQNCTPATSPSEDSTAQALEEYLAAAEAGTAPPREQFLARYPELAEDLDGCLAALDFIGRAAEGPRSVVAEVAGAVPAEQPLGQLGDFRILREVGRGGMGVVYEAEQVSLGRRVALKVLPFAATMDPRQLQRFHNEARAAASLDHPHIVHVHAVGCERAVHFYAMQFIEGQTLAAVIADLRQRGGWPVSPDARPTTAHVPEAPAPAAPSGDTAPRAAASTERTPLDRAHFRRVAELGIQAAEALDHAHTLGIVHRDVKPANLLVDERGGLWVTDFGLAHIQSDARLTMTGDLVGTLRYMSPEQALAKRVVVDHRTDIYSMGATLYELLTLEPAFRGNDRQELLRQIAFEEPRAPRRVNKAIPAELETIVQTAMEKNPAERYATAKELADDLRRWLEEQPIRARPPSLVQRARKWMRRHAAVVRVGAGALIVIAAALVLSTVLVASAYQSEAARRKEADQARDAEEEQRHTVERERDTAQRRLYNTQMQLAWRAWQEGSIQLVQERLNPYVPQPGKRDLRGWEWYYLHGLASRARLTIENQLAGRDPSGVDQSAINGLAFSPDGRRLACAMDVFTISGEYDGVIIVREGYTGREIFHRPIPGRYVQRLEWSPGGERLTCFTRGGLRVWNGASGEELFSRDNMPHHVVTSAAWSPDGKFLAVAWCHGEGAEGGAGGDMAIEIWEPAARKVTHTLSPPTVPGSTIASVAWSPESQRLAAVRTVNRRNSADQIFFWDLPSKRQSIAIATDFHSFSGWFPGRHGLAWSPDGKSIAWCGGPRNDPASPKKRIGIWKVDTGAEVIHTQDLRLQSRPDLVWNSDGRFLMAMPDRGAEIGLVLNAVTGNVTFGVNVSGDPSDLSWFALSPDGQQLATTARFGTVKVWDIASGRETAWIRGHTATVSAVAWSPDGKRLASGDHAGTVKIWDVAPERTGDFLTVGGYGGEPTEGMSYVAWASDSRRLAVAFGSSTNDRFDRIRIWDVETGGQIQSLLGGRSIAEIISWSPNGQHLAAITILAKPGSSGNVLKVWNASSWEEIQSINFGPHEKAGIYSKPGGLAFSADSKRLAVRTGRKDAKNSFVTSEFRVWDVTSWQEVPPSGPRLRVDGASAILSPDWRRVAFMDVNDSYSLWMRDLTADQGGSARKKIGNGRTDVRAHVSAWSPDGARLAYAVYTNRGRAAVINICDISSGKQLLTCRGHTDQVWKVAWSPDGRRLASTGFDGTVRIWETTDGMELLTLPGPPSIFDSLAWSPDGKRLAAGGHNGEVRVWDAFPAHRRQATIAEIRKAIGVKNDHASALCNLGAALLRKGDIDGAIAEFRKAIRFKKDYAVAHLNLGDALRQKADIDGAIAAYRKAIDIDPKDAKGHTNLGVALQAKGQLDGAIAAYRKAIDINPKYAEAHNNLGVALQAKGQLDGAIAAYRKAIDINPKCAEAHCSLGLILPHLGRFSEALTYLRRGHQLGSRKPRWPYPSAQWVKRCERLVELDGKLPAILSGKKQPANAIEHVEYAQVCQMKHHYASAARLFREAIAAKSDLVSSPGNGLRYDAACAAALAGNGAGKDAAKLTDAERAGFRKQALDWLRADLDAWRRLLVKEPGKAAPMVAQKMQHWQNDPDFKGMRGRDALGKLPEAERKDWQKLWADVADRLARAQAKTASEQRRGVK